MKMKITQPYSKEFIFKALDCLEIHIDVQETSEAIPLNRLFEVAVRKNKKRLFLFVSKILGKHLAVDPYIVRLGGILLAEAYYKKQTGKGLQEERLLKLFNDPMFCKKTCEEALSITYPLNQETLFIGFAETATGLGHSMFSGFDYQATFIHTTREPIISEKPTFVFEEEHSHATGHECYTQDPLFFKRFSHIVLVDDEITTGNTALNLIEALHEKSGAKVYSVVALLDWRSEIQQEKAALLAQKLGVTIEFISIVQGTISPNILKPLSEEALKTKEILRYPEQRRENGFDVEDATNQIGVEGEYETLHVSIDTLMTKGIKGGDGKEKDVKYMKASGRFGLTALENKKYEARLLQIGESLARYRTSQNTLCIGTEEFIYIPAVIASAMGEGICYQSTTRSPIIALQREDYPLRVALAYRRPEDETVINYIYNIEENKYEEAFWFFERDIQPEFKQMMAEAFGKKGIKKLYFICCDDEWEGSDE